MPTQTIFFCISLSVDDQLVELTYQPSLTNWGKVVLEIGAALFYYQLGQLIYYKMGQVLLQIGANVIANSGSYYKMGQLLQIGA